MKLKLTTMIVATLISTSGCAQLTPNEVAGAVVGGVVGNHIGGGTGRTVATAAGAVIGANVGRQIGPQPVSVYGYTFPTQSRGIPQAYYDGTTPIYDRVAPCDYETHIDGVYNPPAARQYCYGKVERERRAQQRYEQDAYRRGFEGR